MITWYDNSLYVFLELNSTNVTILIHPGIYNEFMYFLQFVKSRLSNNQHTGMYIKKMNKQGKTMSGIINQHYNVIVS